MDERSSYRGEHTHRQWRWCDNDRWWRQCQPELDERHNELHLEASFFAGNLMRGAAEGGASRQCLAALGASLFRTHFEKGSLSQKVSRHADDAPTLGGNSTRFSSLGEHCADVLTSAESLRLDIAKAFKIRCKTLNDAFIAS